MSEREQVEAVRALTGMEARAFQATYLTNAPFYNLVNVVAPALAAAGERERQLVEENIRVTSEAARNLRAAREEHGRLKEALTHALDRYECDFPNEENETDCGNCARCLMRVALAEEDGNGR